MRTIYKFPLVIQDEQEIHLPASALVRHVGLDPTGQVCLWIEFETEAAHVWRRVFIRGTGHAVPGGPPNMGRQPVFAGTVVAGAFVWHIWLETAR